MFACPELIRTRKTVPHCTREVQQQHSAAARSGGQPTVPETCTTRITASEHSQESDATDVQPKLADLGSRRPPSSTRMRVGTAGRVMRLVCSRTRQPLSTRRRRARRCGPGRRCAARSWPGAAAPAWRRSRPCGAWSGGTRCPPACPS